VTKRQSELFAHFAQNPPAPEALILEFESRAKLSLPLEYREFLLSANGGIGRIGETYLELWSVDTILTSNTESGMAEFAPGLLAIGANGGGEAVVMDFRGGAPSFGAIPFSDLGYGSFMPIAVNFHLFLETISASGLFGS
jgi:hypothetical protein